MAVCEAVMLKVKGKGWFRSDRFGRCLHPGRVRLRTRTAQRFGSGGVDQRSPSLFDKGSQLEGGPISLSFLETLRMKAYVSVESCSRSLKPILISPSSGLCLPERWQRARKVSGQAILKWEGNGMQLNDGHG